MLNDETAYKLLRMLEADPHMSQRAIAKQLDISLGKVNYCLKSLIDKGVLKARNFYKSKNKTAYAYFITPAGIEEKAKITYRFLKTKVTEYEKLHDEIEELRAEAQRLQALETTNASEKPES
jgi:EPS-associated MarR family transcriptional regulator